MSLNEWVRPTIFAGCGGALNAFLCYSRFPVAIPGSEDVFKWHIIPAGALHGALIVVITLSTVHLFNRQRAWVHWLGAPTTGYLSGLISWIPLNASLDVSWSLYTDLSDLLWWPLVYFGLVGLLLYVGLVFLKRLSTMQALPYIVVGVLSGTIGSLWWWIQWKPWYFSILHGAIWGTCVGVGLWQRQRARAN